MKFKAFIEILPRWPFGVPNGEDQIVPAAPGKTETHPILVGTFQQFGFNTLPEYRKSEQAVQGIFQCDGYSAKVKDNFLELLLESDRSEVQGQVNAILDWVTQNLSVDFGFRFTYKIHGIIDEEKRPAGSGRISFKGLFQYDIARTQSLVTAAFGRTPSADAPLARALRYFAHAQFLQDETWNLAEPGSQEESFIAASSYLHFWKAITILLGERPVRGWATCSNLQELGLQEYAAELETAGNIRNNYDVAHARIDARGKDLVAKQLGKAAVLSATIIKAYRDVSLDAGRPIRS